MNALPQGHRHQERIGTTFDNNCATHVAIRHVSVVAYPEYPYCPPELYPELCGICAQTDPTNLVYEAVRNLLADLQLDRDNFGGSAWNPFRSYIAPGQRAVIKPNWVLHANQSDTQEIESLITHTSVIRVVMDYLIRALDRYGTIEIADAPLQDCDFQELTRRSLIKELVDEYRERFPGIYFSVLDLRKTVLRNPNQRVLGIEKQVSQSGDPRGYAMIDLAHESLLTDVQHRFRRFRVANYDHRLMNEHHNRTTHEYLVSNSILSADFIVNVPKLKCHIKAGITGALKNLVGINGNKEYLPHHINGFPGSGGDQHRQRNHVMPLVNRVNDDYWMQSAERSRVRNMSQSLFLGILRRVARLLPIAGNEAAAGMFNGGWSGNDTIPRTTLDLNNALYFYDVDTQRLEVTALRKVLHIVDGVIAGEGYGPLRPTPKEAGVVLGGLNPLLVDICGAKLMGLDPMKVPLLRHGMVHEKSRLSDSSLTLEDLVIVEDGRRTRVSKVRNLEFDIPQGWRDAMC